MRYIVAMLESGSGRLPLGERGGRERRMQSWGCGWGKGQSGRRKGVRQGGTELLTIAAGVGLDVDCNNSI